MPHFYPQAMVYLQVVLETLGAGPEDATAIPLVPISCSVHRNSYKEADTFEVKFERKDLPITPAQIKASAAEIHLFNRRNLSEPFKDPQGTLISKQPPTIGGLVDEVNIELGADGQYVTIEGRDYTSLFTDVQYQDDRMPTGKRLDEHLEDLIARTDKVGILGLSVEPESLRASLPTVGAHATRTNKKGVPVQEDKNVWDVMYELATRHGFILFVEGLDVVLTKPHILTQHRAADARKLTWGSNIESLSISRHMGKERTPQIQINSWDDRTRKTHTGKFPPDKDKKAAKVGLGKSTRDQVRIYDYPGISDEALLAEIAETTFNLVSRGEQSIKASTQDLLDESGLEFLTLHAGDAVELTFESVRDKDFSQLETGERITYLLQRDYSGPIAKLLAQNWEQIKQIKGPYRVREVTFDWDRDSGIKIEFELSEFVDTRLALTTIGTVKAIAGAIGKLAAGVADLRPARLL